MLHWPTTKHGNYRTNSIKIVGILAVQPNDIEKSITKSLYYGITTMYIHEGNLIISKSVNHCILKKMGKIIK